MKKICLTISLSLGLASCASLGKHSYDVRSETKSYAPSEDINQQSQEFGPNINAPLKSVCHLKTTRRGPRTLWLWESQNTGSAALIENRFLLTAAHNVFDYPANKLTSISVTCGETDTAASKALVTLDRQQIKTSVHVPRYEYRIRNEPKNYEFDYAFIDLGKDISQISEFSLGPINPNIQKVFIGGYPGNRISTGDKLHSGNSTETFADQNRLSYDIYTATGNSGGPIWTQGTEGIYPIIAVHVTDSGGRLVNDTLISDWNAWRQTR